MNKKLNTDLILYECFGHYYCLDCIVSINKCSICRINPTQINVIRREYSNEYSDDNTDSENDDATDSSDSD